MKKDIEVARSHSNHEKSQEFTRRHQKCENHGKSKEKSEIIW